MDERTADKFIDATHWARTFGAASLGFLALFLAILSVSALKEYRFIGSGVNATNTITVSGEGEGFSLPLRTVRVKTSFFTRPGCVAAYTREIMPPIE